MKETRPRQPGDMLSGTDGRIDEDTEIADCLRWLDGFTVDRDWIEGASCQKACRTQPDELRLRWIQPQAVARHPTAHDLDAVCESIGELRRVIGEAVIIDLQIICVSMDEEPKLSGSSKHIGSVYRERNTESRGMPRCATV